VTSRWLAAQLQGAKSYEQIGRELGLHGSTVAYWAKKHGLRSEGSDRFGARGAPDRKTIQALAARGATLAEMALEIDRSIATVRHWLSRWKIERNRPRAAVVDLATAPPVRELSCPRHGRTAFRLNRRGYYRCARCGQDRVVERRRRVKRILVEEAGGRCQLCGYDRCVSSLQFHHLDPSEKDFALSRQGVTRSLAEARSEARKCALLCANCHAEVEAGYRALTPMNAAPAAEAPRGGFEPP
jgi:DNA-directed RNA polymerase subunit RPC12/RpoP